MKIIGAAIGNCVHVAGIINFFRLAERCGYETEFLGPAADLEKLLLMARNTDAEIVAVSYRLTPEVAEGLFGQMKELLSSFELEDRRFIFGGTAPVCRRAEETGLFEAVFDGRETVDDIIAYLRGRDTSKVGRKYPDTLKERIDSMRPFPLIRHHFGLPSLEDTIAGVAEIAEARILDVISLGPDQNAQESFFRPDEIDELQDGGGGVPVRSREDFRAIYEASRRGNYPLLRSYSGTRDTMLMAEMLEETIDNAWCAVPLSWYNVLDGRGPRGIIESITGAQNLLRWHAERGIPVEMNEAHHWSLRDAHDTIAVVMAYLGAYNAKAYGVADYVAQYMFNTPAATSPRMDLAKMLAKKELIAGLHDESFRSITQVRAGLTSFPVDPGAAKGQLAASTMVSMALKPTIVHVVGFCEADHAATPSDVIESCRIVRRVIRNGLEGMPDMTSDIRVQRRKEELIEEAGILLSALRKFGADSEGDPLTDPRVLAGAIRCGILDAPHLKGNPGACGQLETRIMDGACRAVDPKTGDLLDERERLRRLGLSPAADGWRLEG